VELSRTEGIKQFLNRIAMNLVISTLVILSPACASPAMRDPGEAISLSALTQVLPPFDNRPDATTRRISENGTNWTFYVARRDGQFVGAAFQVTSRRGYAGPIQLLVGANADDTLHKVQVLAQRETRGLGSKIAIPPFSSQFEGLSILRTKWAIRKDRGDIDAVTGATISSRAVVTAIRSGLAVYHGHKTEIMAAGK
jgi:Na+-translocating ferredoxin:NAD+ oxidoreductase subunit G